MLRTKLNELIAWRNSTARKPLIIKGARQTGKTWLMKEFGRTCYEQTLYINLEKSRHLKELFTGPFDIQRTITAFQAESGMAISSSNTLIILDEIQEIPEAITALKYFSEEAPDYHIICAGSLLGVALHPGFSFPVGKVHFMDLFPMTFSEFLLATGEKSLAEILQGEDWKLISVYKPRYIERLKQYYYVGGMPEAVLRFSETNSFIEVREIQKEILRSYDLDFSKHVPSGMVPRIRMLWNSIPGQLAKENKKFKYGMVKSGSRAKDFETALAWLINCGQAAIAPRVTRPGIPLKAYEDSGSFKLFCVDTGLMSAMTDLDPKTLLSGNKMFTEFKGALTEQYIFQQLRCIEGITVFYWSAEKSTAEVDFVIQYQGYSIPLEVKAEENLQAKSLKVFREKYSPPVSVRFSMSDYRTQDGLVNIPLYAAGRLIETIERIMG